MNQNNLYICNSSFDIYSKVSPTTTLKKDKDGINPVLTKPSNFFCRRKKDLEGFLFWMGFSFSVLFPISFHLREIKSNLFQLLRTIKIPALSTTDNRRGRWEVSNFLNSSPMVLRYRILGNREANERCEIKKANANSICLKELYYLKRNNLNKNKQQLNPNKQ